MLQTPVLQIPVAVPTERRRQPDSEGNDPLWRLAGDVHTARALIVAEHGLDLMCGLIRRGCPAATILRPGEKPDIGGYDLVLVPQVAAFPSPEHLIRLACRSLDPQGRLIVGVSSRDAAALVRRLRLNGFTTVHAAGRPGSVLLRADRRRMS